jgi:hypothetical protein
MRMGEYFEAAACAFVDDGNNRLAPARIGRNYSPHIRQLVHQAIAD